MTFSVEKRNSFGRLLVVVSIFLLTGSAAFGQSSGFFFGAGGMFDLDSTHVNMKKPFNKQSTSDENKMTQAAGGFGLFGWSVSKLNISGKIGGFSKSYLSAGQPVTYTQIPIMAKVAYVTPWTVSLQPNAFAGASFDIVTGRDGYWKEVSIFDPPVWIEAEDGSLDINALFGVGIDLSFSFPGDHIALFAGATYSVLIPTYDATGWYFFPSVNVGLTFRPGKQKTTRRPSNGGGSIYYANADQYNSPVGGYGVDTMILSSLNSTPQSYIPSTQPTTQSTQPAAPSRAPAAPVQTAPAKAPTPAKTPAPAPAKTPAKAPAAAPAPAAPVQETEATETSSAPAPAAPAKKLSKKELSKQRAQVAALSAEVKNQQKELNDGEPTEASQREVLNDLKANQAKVPAKQIDGVPVNDPDSRVNTVYFLPDMSSPMVMYSLPIVDEVGKELQADSNLVVIIRGYSAPAGDIEGQLIISESRARYCAEYLNKNFNIPYNRMTIEWFGAAKKPEQSAAYDQKGLYRAAELVTKVKSNTVSSASENTSASKTSAKKK